MYNVTHEHCIAYWSSVPHYWILSHAMTFWYRVWTLIYVQLVGYISNLDFIYYLLLMLCSLSLSLSLSLSFCLIHSAVFCVISLCVSISWATIRWCCSNRQLGCDLQPTPKPYDCSLGLSEMFDDCTVVVLRPRAVVAQLLKTSCCGLHWMFVLIQKWDLPPWRCVG